MPTPRVRTRNDLVELLRRYGSHRGECFKVTFYQRSALAVQTMLDVLGPPACNCGWDDVAEFLKE